jgi:CRISPR-associated endonuclease/helicase Cas3
MCPVHRKRELEAIRERLSSKDKEGNRIPCRVISTQLIEAGIDVDFPSVYRAMGPLEAIVQAAGRCNRENLLTDDQEKLVRGKVVVFLPADHKLPKGDYEVRESLARTELREDKNLHHPDVFIPYFRKVYENVSTAPKVAVYGGEKPFQEAHAQLYFEQVAAAYQMIEGEMIPVIVRGYDRERVDGLLAILQHSRDKPERREAWRALQGYTINLYPNQAKKLGHLLSDVPELLERAERLRVDPPRVKAWPTTAKYHAKLGIVPDFNLEDFANF